jgi:predicted transposase/invertase (TIGR01784 family)
MCRINPRIDFAFKKLFGSEENKDLLIGLINSIIEPNDKIEEVTLRNPYNLADYLQDKMSILDIKAVDEKGVVFNVEMQIGEDLNFDKRSIYYWSKLVTEQLSEGMMYRQLNKTISINILDFNIIDNENGYHNTYKILNEKTGKSDDLHDMFEMHYIELKKFKKDFDDIGKAIDRWILFLNKFSKLNKRDLPKSMKTDPLIVKAIEAVDRMFDEEERMVYENRMRVQMDFESRYDSAITKGLMEGRAKGLEEGKAKGLEEGIARGIAQNEEKNKKKAEKHKIDLIKNMLAKGIDTNTISEITNTSIEQIEKLR